MKHDLSELRTFFTAALASDALDALGYMKNTLGQDIRMLSGEGVKIGRAHV